MTGSATSRAGEPQEPSVAACFMMGFAASSVSPRSAALAQVPQGNDLDVLAPISDVRGTAAYRRDAGLTLVRRALAALADD